MVPDDLQSLRAISDAFLQLLELVNIEVLTQFEEPEEVLNHF